MSERKDFGINKSTVYLSALITILIITGVITYFQPYKQSEIELDGQISYEITLINHTIPLSDIINLINPDITNATITYDFGEITVKGDIDLRITMENMDWLVKAIFDEGIVTMTDKEK